MNDYSQFLASKQLVVPSAGIDVPNDAVNPLLFVWQKSLVRWALRKGRSALFCDTGLGKTFMQLEWARLTGVPTLILAPLAVARQTVREASRLGIELVYARSQADAGPLTITNYEMVDHFDPSQFGAVVLDESSIVKSYEGKTRTKLIAAFRDTPYRLCCTATPAPNDIAELANHAEFLGVLSRVEMLATFFVHDDKGWRLKGHAKAPFYQWLASWGMSVKRPSDIGFDDADFALPSLDIRSSLVPTDFAPEGQLFFTSLKGITDRSAVRRGTIHERVAVAADLINGESAEPWIAWVGLNDEGRHLASCIPDCVLVEGQDSPEEKAEALEAFVRGDVRVLVTKVSIAGFGLNLQHCARMAFVGLSDSYEAYYQAIRRCWRFGQTRPVVAHIVLTEPEEAIHANVLRKEREAEAMSADLVKHVAAFERAELNHVSRRDAYEPAVPLRLPFWLKGAA